MGCLGKGQTQQAEPTEEATSTRAPSATPEPTNTPVPPTNTPEPTATPLPTDTPTPIPTDTPTPVPTDTPTVTATPGPVVFTDDFSTQIVGAWGECSGCEWKDGKLYMGPFEPSANDMHEIVCEACGEATYYRFSVDATFVEGQVDRFFGVLMGWSEDYYIYAGVSPWQASIIEKLDYAKDLWSKISPGDVWDNNVKASYGTNRIEVIAQLSTVAGKVDYYLKINKGTSYVLYTQPAAMSKVGLVIGWHSVGAWFDNFAYEEIEVK